jgi:hypothetical protein
MEPWYKVVIPRREVREGRSFNPDEFAIALEQVVAGTAPEDYRDPRQFFDRTSWTRALREHVGMVLRRLTGKTENTAPVITLITQFGGGKTHTLTALYHLSRSGAQAADYAGVADVLRESGGGSRTAPTSVPQARVAVFVGNAWDPQEGRETPWIDIARQLAGERGVEALGVAARTTPPGTESIGRLYQAAGAPVLILFDEVLNFLGRHRSMAEAFHAFIQNLTVATTGATHAAAVISLPRSQVEMTDWDREWQERITKVVRRVAKDLIVNDEAEISEVIRRRLFEDWGDERMRKHVARKYADWCFERRAQLPPEWTAVDTATTEAKAREYLRSRFEACYPFHPATLSVFQRKWQALPQYQQTRGTLAMLAQWISWAYRTGFTEARREPLVTLGSAPLHDLGFRSTILGQLGESRLVAAIEADIAGEHAHARALDADTKVGAVREPPLLRDIHRRVGTAILFESSGGQTDKVAHLPELRFALGGPEVDTTSVDNAAFALEDKAYFIRRVGSDGFKIGHQPTLKKVVSDRRASLDEDSEIKPAMRKLVEEEFRRGASVPVVFFPQESAEIADSPKLTVVVVEPEAEWTGNAEVGAVREPPLLRERLATWTRERGRSSRLYPASLVWCLKKPGKELRQAVELWLAWRRVKQELEDGTLGGEFGRSEQREIHLKVKEAEQAARDEVWGGYRFVVLLDNRQKVEKAQEKAGNEDASAAPSDRQQSDGLKVIDLGAGHASSGETLCGRVIAALKSNGLLNESVGAGYLERQWPPAFKESGAWPLMSLRQSFSSGSLTRLLDPDGVLRTKIVEFVARGDFGLAWGQKPDGTFARVWFGEHISPEDVSFEADVFLLTKTRAQALKAGIALPHPSQPKEAQLSPASAIGSAADDEMEQTPETASAAGAAAQAAKKTIRLVGTIPSEMWSRLGTKLIPKLRSGGELCIEVDMSTTVNDDMAAGLIRELRQILSELGLADKLRVE